jgi:hypothetical protein
MAKSGVLVVVGAAVALALHGAGLDWRVLFAVKIAAFVPAFVIGVVLLDLVTKDDLARAQAVDIGVPWMSGLRDRAVAFAAWTERTIGRRRPDGLATAEGH